MDTAIAETVSSKRPSKVAPAELRLHKEMEAVRVLREQITVLAGEDVDFIRDTIEGETSLHEAISMLTASEAEDRALIAGIKELVDKLEGRSERIERRADHKRAMIASAMDLGELPKLETPAGTVSVRSVPPKLVLIEEADIPARYWKAAAPALDKKAVLDALKARQAAVADALALDDPGERTAALEAAKAAHPEIPGATLSNGSRTISIRVK